MVTKKPPKPPPKSDKERRENIEKALERVKKARGGTTGGTIISRGGGGHTGGTQIIVDVNTGKSQIVATTPEAKKRISQSRVRAVHIRQQRKIQRETTARTIQTLRRTGVKNIK